MSNTRSSSFGCACWKSQEQLLRLAREISNRELDTDDVRARPRRMLGARTPEMQGLTWIDERRRVSRSVELGQAWPPSG